MEGEYVCSCDCRQGEWWGGSDRQVFLINPRGQFSEVQTKPIVGHFQIFQHTVTD